MEKSQIFSQLITTEIELLDPQTKPIRPYSTIRFQIYTNFPYRLLADLMDGIFILNIK